MATEQKVTRKLSAILSADVKGYSLLMSNDEAFKIQTLKDYRIIMSEIIKQHSGRVVDAPGDNMLAEFSSVVNAVQCSVEIQSALKVKNVDLPDDKRLEFRIGVNIGDVVQDGESLYGEGVNIAARIEGLADPGGVCISRGAYDHIRNKLGFGYQYLGDHSVKNIKHPVRVYKILMAAEDAGKLIGEEQKPLLKTLAWSAVIVASIMFITYLFYQKTAAPEFEPASIEKMVHTLPDKPSIAVLAFDNMTGDKEQDYFCDGLSEEIIAALSSVPELFVIARNSSFTYKGKSVKVQQISEELGVQYVLEGSIRKSGKKIRITAQLIDALKGHHLWAESYDRNIEDLFVVQEDIALKVITELQVKLIGREEVRLRAPCSENLKAYLSYLKAQDHFFRFSREDNNAARRLLEKAIDLDPVYACAYSMLGGTYRLDVYLGATESPKQSFGTAKKMFEKSIDLNPSLAGPHALLASIYCHMGQYEQAIVEAEKALAISPDSVLANGEMGNVLYSSGRSKEAITFCKKAIRLDPFSTTYFRALGMSYLLSGQNEQAIQILKKLIDSKPAYLPAHLILAAAYSAAEQMEEANAAASVILKMAPKFTLDKYSKTWRLKNPADKEIFMSNLRKAGLPEKPLLPLPDKPSIAVLAFDNMTGDSTQDYFSDGIAEEIITVLSKADELFVIARNSSFSYKGKPIKVQQIGKELGVRYVLEGSVRKSGNKVRVTAQLIDAMNGQHLWAKSFDRDFDNIFEIQDEITMKVVTSLRVELTEGEQARMFHPKNINPKVYKKQLQTLSLWREGNQESLILHGQLAQEIIDIAPESDIGYRILGWNHWGLAMAGKSPLENSKKAFQLAQKALSIDDSNGFSHGYLGSVYLVMKKYEKAIASGKRAIELQPNGAQAHLLLGNTLVYAGRFDEAIVYLKMAIRFNPFPPYFYYLHLGKCYLFKEQFGKALSEFKKAAQRAPSSGFGHFYLAVNYIFLDLKKEARASAAKALELNHNISVSYIHKISRFKNQAHTQYLIDAMRKAGFPE